MSDITALYYSHAEPPGNVGNYCRQALSDSLDGLPIVAVVDPALTFFPRRQFGRIASTVLYMSSTLLPGHADIAQRILKGLAHIDTEYVALCEHDVIYPVGYFEAALAVADGIGERWTYCGNAVHLTARGWGAHANYPRARLLSCLTARRADLVSFFAERSMSIDRGERVRVAEPIDDGCVSWECVEPVIDIRHGENLTGDRRGRPIDVGLRPSQAVALWEALGLET